MVKDWAGLHWDLSSSDVDLLVVAARGSLYDSSLRGNTVKVGCCELDETGKSTPWVASQW